MTEKDLKRVTENGLEVLHEMGYKITSKKRFINDEDGNITDIMVDRTLYVENQYTKVDYFVNLLNELYDENEELKEEKEELQSKAKTLLDFYSKRYGDAVFNRERHSKTLRGELWLVKEVLCELGLYDDGDVE